MKKTILAGLLLTISNLAVADGAYFMLSGGKTTALDADQQLAESIAFWGSVGTTITAATVDDNSTAWGIGFGGRFADHFGLEFSYHDLDRYDFSGTINGNPGAGGTGVDLYAISVLGYMPVSEKLNFYGKLGISRWAAEIEIDTPFVNSYRETGTGPIGGIGLEYTLSKTHRSRDFWGSSGGFTYRIRLGWDRYLDVGNKSITGESDIDFYRFDFLIGY
jgi:hypothetical protein